MAFDVLELDGRDIRGRSTVDRRAELEKRHLRAILSEEAEVTAILTADNIASLFEPANYLGSADKFIDAVLDAASAEDKLSTNLTLNTKG